MLLRRKILLFYGFLLLNYLFHAGELYVRILHHVLIPGSTAFLLFAFMYLLIYALLLYVGWLLLNEKPSGYRGAKTTAVGFLGYGLILAIASVYRNGQVPGNFSGFLFVMICLPLLLQLSDYKKMQENTDATSTLSLPRSEQGER